MFRNRKWKTGLIAGAMVLLFFHPGRGQGTDPAKPLPLAPGVNKGNIDNFSGPRYFFFTAGPGPVTVDMAFKQTNLSIGALRQVMHFNFYNLDKDGKQIAAYQVASLDKLERLTAPGTVRTRTRYEVEIKAADGFVKMGGYYELALSGVVDFGGAQNASQDVKPEQPFLVQPVRH